MITGSGRFYDLETVAEVPEIKWVVAAGGWYSGDMSLWAGDDYSNWHEVMSGATFGTAGTVGAAEVPPGDTWNRFWQFRLNHPSATNTFWSGCNIDYFRLIQADYTDLLHLQNGTPWPVPTTPPVYVGPVVPYVATMWQAMSAEPGRTLKAFLNHVMVAGSGGASSYGPLTGDQMDQFGIQPPYLAAGGCTATWTFDIAVDPTIPPGGTPGQPPMRLHAAV